MTTPRINPIETLRLSSRDKRRLVQQINQNSRTVPSQMERRSLRVEFNVGHVVVSITHPNRQNTAYSVAPRNLSRRGIAFIHGQFIYVNSPCMVMMPMLDGRWANIAGKVVGCRHLSGLLHEISVAFKQDIELSQFVTLTDDQKVRLDREHRQRLTPADAAPSPSDAVRQGMVVVDDAASRRLVALWLQQLGFETMDAQPEDVEAWVKQRGFDLVIVDLMADKGKGDRVIRKLAASGFKGNILAISANGSEHAKSEATKAGAGAFLEMPFTLLTLQETIDALAKHDVDKTARGDGEPLFSSTTTDPQMRPLVEEFVSTLSEHARELGDAFKSHDQDGVLRICRRLKGTGGGYGFEPITEAAKLAILSLEAQEHDLQQIKQRVDELVALLHRARAT
jgi:CheY-like chemotaxis protein